jgi:hypothetical protein
VNYAIFRLKKGGVGYLNMTGKLRADIYYSEELPAHYIIASAASYILDGKIMLLNPQSPLIQ